MPGVVSAFMPVSRCGRRAIPSMYLLCAWSTVLSKVKRAPTAHGDWALGVRGAGGYPCAQACWPQMLSADSLVPLTVLPKFVGLGHMAMRHK